MCFFTKRLGCFAPVGSGPRFIITHDGAPPSEIWTVTSSDKNPTRPMLVRASLPRSLTSARATYLARQEVAQLSVR